MASLGTPDQLPMQFANIPADQPVHSVAEDVKPFAPIDSMQQASNAYKLADQMGQQQDAQLERQDRSVLTDYLKNGGNMQTPEGLNKALTDMQGKLSPKSYQDLTKQAQSSLNWTEKLNDYYTKLPEQALQMQVMKSENVLKGLEGPLEVYKKSMAEKGEAAALPDFEAAKQATVQYAAQLKDAAGNPVFTPDELKHFQTMTPGAVESELNTTKFHTDRMKSAAEMKFKQSQTAKDEAQTKVLEQGGPAAALYAQMVAQYGEESPQAKAALTKMEGGGAMARLQGVPENQIKPEERKLAVGQWIQNPSSLRGLNKTYQQNVIKWASELGITADDVASGQAGRKFQLAAATASGHRAGQMASVEATMPGLITDALETSKALPRGKFVPLNKLEQMGQAAFSDPDLKDFALANQAVASEYQQVISRGGTNVTALKEAMDFLRTADSPEAYERSLQRVQKEVQRNVDGAKKVASEIGGSSQKKLGFASSGAEKDQAAIFNKEYATLQTDLANAKDPISKARAEGDLDGLKREAKRSGVTLGEKTAPAKHSRPAGFTDEQWAAYQAYAAKQ